VYCLKPQVVESENQEKANTHGEGGVSEQRAKCKDAMTAVVASRGRAANAIPAVWTENLPRPRIHLSLVDVPSLSQIEDVLGAAKQEYRK
jgi:hypothetical protein